MGLLRGASIRACGPVALIAGLISLAATVEQQAPGRPRTGGTAGTAVNRAGTRNTPVQIYPGQDIQANVSAAPGNTTFLLKAGVHRTQTIRPKDGDTFTGESGAVLSGARLLTSFTRNGAFWVAANQTQEGTQHGECQAGFPRCRIPEELFIDDRLLVSVDALSKVTTGTWYFDYAGDRIYLADDPSGHRVETSVTATAIQATGNSVTVSDLVVEKYANLAQHGAITAEGRTGWVIVRNEVRWNHGLGIRTGTGARVTGNNVHHNGQLGISGSGADVLVESNEIAYNNTAHFDASWEAGGTKFVSTERLVVRGNFVHHNDGPGLWTDTDNVETLYENNTVEDNQQIGIFHEISYAAVVRNNIVRRNGFGFSSWVWGAGILVAASPGVEIYENTVEDNANGIVAAQQRRGSGARGPYEISNLWVHDNTVVMVRGVTGLAQDVGDTSYFTSRNNRFDRNRYVLRSPGRHFTWIDSERSESEWTSYGQDVHGSFSR